MPTLFDKLWQAHVVREAAGEPTLLYIDLHLIHEVTSPQAFAGLREAGRGGGPRGAGAEPPLLYIDLHLIHEVTSPQAFAGLREAGRSVRRPDLTFGTVDHNVPTTDRNLPIADAVAANQVETLRRNCSEFGVQLFDIPPAA